LVHTICISPHLTVTAHHTVTLDEYKTLVLGHGLSHYTIGFGVQHPVNLPVYGDRSLRNLPE
jgi:hypothetical protein